MQKTITSITRKAYSRYSISWKEKTKTLTIGARKGEYPGMIKERKINVGFVGEDHGAGIEVVKNIDKELLYKGKSIRVKEH